MTLLKKNKNIVRVSAAFLGLVLLVLILRAVSWSEVLSRVQDISWFLVGVALICYVIANVCRASRFSILLGGRLPTRALFFVVARQNFWNVLTPFRLGEVSYLFETAAGGSGGRALSSLVAARCFDALAVIILFLLGVFLAGVAFPGKGTFALIGAATLLLSILFMFFLLYLGRAGGKGFSRAAALFPERFRALAFQFIREAVEGFSDLQSKHLILRTAALSLASWGATFLSGAFLLVASGLRPDMSLLFVYAFPVFVSLTPLIAFGGFGSYEASVVFPLIILGFSVSAAASVGLIVHVIELFFVTLLWALSLILDRRDGELKTQSANLKIATQNSKS